MIYYHFTAREYLRAIAREGLRKGEVALSPTDVLNAVWLTTDPDPAGHGLGEARQLTVDEKRILGLPPFADLSFPDKRAIRFRTVIPSRDRRLAHWPKWARKRLEAWWYEALREADGSKSDTWWLYWGTIPADALEAIDLATGQPLAGLPDAFRPSAPSLTGASVVGPAPLPAAGAVAGARPGDGASIGLPWPV
jgi:hypothetical protein